LQKNRPKRLRSPKRTRGDCEKEIEMKKTPNLAIPEDPAGRERAQKERTQAIEAFRTAALAGDAPTALRLLAEGRVSPREPVDERGTTPLMAAAEGGCVELVRAVLPESDVRARRIGGQDALMAAAENGRAECVEALIPRSDALASDWGGRTALMHAADSRCARCVELLIPVSDPRAKDAAKSTALMHAAASGQERSVRLLMEVSDLKAKDRDGYNALMEAVAHGSTECALALLPVSPKRARDVNKSALLHVAAAALDSRVIDAIGSLSDANAKNCHGLTPLMAATISLRGAPTPHRKKHIRAIETLLPASDLDLRDGMGRRAEDHAAGTPIAKMFEDERARRGLAKAQKERSALARVAAGASKKPSRPNPHESTQEKKDAPQRQASEPAARRRQARL
jgi:ankyrin repeat protein